MLCYSSIRDTINSEATIEAGQKITVETDLKLENSGYYYCSAKVWSYQCNYVADYRNKLAYTRFQIDPNVVLNDTWW